MKMKLSSQSYIFVLFLLFGCNNIKKPKNDLGAGNLRGLVKSIKTTLIRVDN
jgi:hypothetical protein